MRKNNVQKKKTLENTLSRILFKILIGIAIAIFAFIIYDKVDLSSTSMTFSSPKKSNSSTHTPSDLKWYNSFKGVENVPAKDKKSSGGNGFKYEGFKK